MPPFLYIYGRGKSIGGIGREKKENTHLLVKLGNGVLGTVLKGSHYEGECSDI